MQSEKHSRRKDAWLAFVLVALAFWTAQANAVCGTGKTGDSLRRSFPGWQVVMLENLRRDDKRLWEKAHPSDCPGNATGNIQSSTTETTVLTVFKDSNGGLQQMLLVANMIDGNYKFSELDGPRTVAYLSVISIARPGKYSLPEKGELKLRRDSILYEAIEAGSVLYYFDDERYKSEVLDE